MHPSLVITSHKCNVWYNLCVSPILFCSKKHSRRTVCFEFWVTGVKKVEQLFHHAPNVVAIHQGETQLHCASTRQHSNVELIIIFDNGTEQKKTLKCCYGIVYTSSSVNHLLIDTSKSFKQSTMVLRCLCTALWSVCTVLRSDVNATYL